MHPVLLDAGLLDINGTFIAELLAFLIMLGVLWKWAYPPIMAAALARQKLIEEQIDSAEKARQAADQRLAEVDERLADARAQAQAVIDSAAKTADQIRQELREKGEEEAKRIIERAQKEIETAQQKAIDAVRSEVADLVVNATERVLGESLDDERHRRLIDRAIAEVAGGQRQG